jgi:phosphatidylethanolamine/phosphatidyl-N-methylethanolamine N-methyltransferase
MWVWCVPCGENDVTIQTAANLKKRTNQRNQRIYRLWAPVYDWLWEGLTLPLRERAAQVLDLQSSERVLLVGVGTGADLPLLPPGVEAVGIDLSPEMLAKAQDRLPLPGREVSLVQGDATRLQMYDGAFDAAALSLVLSVVPDPVGCLRETLRVIRPGGRVVILDKFLFEGQRVSVLRCLINVVTQWLGTDINRRFDAIVDGAPCTITHQEASMFGGVYRVILLQC